MAIAELKKNGMKKTVMLTGDSKKVADKVATEIGIDMVRSELLPGDKVEQVEKLLAEKGDKEALAFVGDGINDAPVLSRADIGVAMGALGSDAAIEAADVVLMDDDPAKIALAMKISKRTLEIVRENIIFALAIKAICLVLGGISGVLVAVFKVPPFIATLGMQLILYGASSIYFDRPPYGAQPIGGIDSKVTQIAIGSIGIGDFQIPYLIIIAAAVCVVMWIVWNKTKFGKYMFAVGGNPEAAKVSGVNVIKTQIMVYAIAGMMYAFAAALEVGRIGSASNTTGNGYEMDAVAACVIGGVSLSGGVGSVGGIVIGVLMFTVINYGLAFIGVNMYWQYIVKGLIILLAVIIDMRKYAKRK